LLVVYIVAPEICCFFQATKALWFCMHSRHTRFLMRSSKGNSGTMWQILEHQHPSFCLHLYLSHIVTTCTPWFVTWLITHLMFKHSQSSLAKPHINPLKTKRRRLYLKTQFVLRSKHFSSRL
jgi:hypothetical protein